MIASSLSRPARGLVFALLALLTFAGFAKVGQRIIVICGVPLGTPGAINILRVAIVGRQSD